MSQKPITINVGEVLRARLGRWSCLLPAFVVRWLERLICQEQLNEGLLKCYPLRGAEFCKAVLEYLDVKLNVEGVALPTDSRVVIVSNHPLGGLDGISMIAWLAEQYPDKHIRFVVNDLLNAVEPLTDVFLPINKHGSQSREAAQALADAFAGDDPIVVYPAGLCSRLGDDGKVADLQWNKMFVARAIASQRSVVPVFFDGENSQDFYRRARLRKRLGLKFNFEMVLLPREMFRARGKQFRLIVGDAIPWQNLRGGAEATAQAADIRQIVYRLQPSNADESTNN